MELIPIENKIFEIRGKQVMLDTDLAEMYGVETRVLKQAVKRNIERFPDDFMFELTKKEFDSLRSQFVTLKNEGRGRHSKYLPYVFTQEGVAMLSGVLRSPVAVQVNINIMRAFVAVRNYLLNESPSRKIEELYQMVKTLENKLEDHIQDWEEESFENEKKFDELYLAFTELAAKEQLASHKTPRKPVGYIKPENENDK
ncbi:ORF6N domain-containing protein [Dysgonomonas sp. 521]|uniref:ORF6N domain-containing protein n=1 Tax=Dysgonomonas sp. 521 TaxID=2302932 RepID=UPI0013D5279E|nr:ORF6N domain-containing protein [Dysgonomonas sp. 521]NDV96572.1 ORF6N domain-containing protein [Dysgonomonas sp. 521]